ncbi:MAG: hemerythrin domain-containing protein [Marmoricola sp.]
MTHESVATALEREHREIDRSMAEFARSGDEDSLRGAIRGLRGHICAEEQFLFPALRGAGLIAPVFVMLREHGQMWALLDDLVRSLDDGIDEWADSDVPRLCAELISLEERHNPKEEQILYPQADRALSTEDLARLRRFLDSGEVPEGWVCEQARIPH